MATVRTQGVKTEARGPGRWVPSTWALGAAPQPPPSCRRRGEENRKGPYRGSEGWLLTRKRQGQGGNAQDFRDDK